MTILAFFQMPENKIHERPKNNMVNFVISCVYHAGAIFAKFAITILKNVTQLRIFDVLLLIVAPAKLVF